MSGIFPDKEVVKRVRDEYPPGTIIVLDEMEDSQAPPMGTLGKVTYVDDTGTIFAAWFSGGGLGVVYGVDRCHIATEDEIKAYLLKIADNQKDSDRCPRCGEIMKGSLHSHAISRALSIIVCDKCGNAEAMEDYYGKRSPLSSWTAIQEAWKIK